MKKQAKFQVGVIFSLCWDPSVRVRQEKQTRFCLSYTLLGSLGKTSLGTVQLLTYSFSAYKTFNFNTMLKFSELLASGVFKKHRDWIYVFFIISCRCVIYNINIGTVLQSLFKINVLNWILHCANQGNNSLKSALLKKKKKKLFNPGMELRNGKGIWQKSLHPKLSA